MKTKNNFLAGMLLCAASLTTSCSDFEEVNKDPNATDLEKIKPEWFFNAAVVGAQQDPHISERIFVLTWKRASRFERGSGLTIGQDNNDYSSDYLSDSYGVGNLKKITQAVKACELKIASGEANRFPYINNLLHISRIWRVYLNYELVSNFGPLPVLDAFNGVVAPYNNEEDIYKYLISELEDAAKALDPSISMEDMKKEDYFYGGNPTQWKKYANSMRMRLAMMISKADPAYAKTAFEAAAKENDMIVTLADMAKVAEKDSWSDLVGVMSRSWNPQALSVTIKNLTEGIGGQAFPVPDSLKSHLKDPKTYLGLNLVQHLPTTTNDPCAGYFFDGIPSIVDPRAAKLFNITGYNDGEIYSEYIGMPSETINLKDDNDANQVALDVRYTWTTTVAGEWDIKGKKSNELTSKKQNYPSLSNAYRKSTNNRVFFGAWETYFLLAEAKLMGWNVPGTAQENYENGVKASFEYHGLKNIADAYLASNDYNRVGTSSSFNHTAEAADYTINYVDGYTKVAGQTTYKYPVNSIHNGGTTNNDALTKVITQKYIAQMPYLPLEAWNDHRRLGLPFFENQAVERDYNTDIQVPLTTKNYMECRNEFYPKRLRYPASIRSNNLEGYNQALQFLNGPDKTTSVLWWNMK